MNTKDQERRMRGAFWAQAQQMMEGLVPGEDPYHITNVGVELEYFLFHPDGRLATDEEKREVLEKVEGALELGAAQLELNPPPIQLFLMGLGDWWKLLHDQEQQVRDVAYHHGLWVGRCGTIPWADPKQVVKTRAERYDLVPDYHDHHRAGWNLLRRNPLKIGPVHLGGAAVCGLINAFQFNLEASSPNDAIDKLNRLMMISPMATALGANARYLNAQDTGWADVRFQAWRLTHDVRTIKQRLLGTPLRIGLPWRYYRNLEDYLKDVASYPFIFDRPEDALQIGLGLFWRDARIKVIGGKLVVEFRPLSMQPTLFGDLALAVFVIGRYLYSKLSKEKLLPMAYVQGNKRSAEQHGLASHMYTERGLEPTPKALMQDILLAEIALKDLAMFWSRNPWFERVFEDLRSRLDPQTRREVMLDLETTKPTITDWIGYVTRHYPDTGGY